MLVTLAMRESQDRFTEKLLVTLLKFPRVTFPSYLEEMILIYSY